MIPRFRAWNSRKKVWIGNLFDNIFVSSGGYGGALLIRKSNEIVLDRELGLYTNDTDYQIKDLPLSYVHIQMSTGIRDKHNQEIFEGDIVKMYSDELLPVVLNHGMFEPVCFYLSKVFEKVGNIFENPELTEHPDFRGHKGDKQ